MEQTLPLFSIIIPTYCRPERLATCLQSLAKIDYPRDRFEIIVVDDGSEMSLEAIVTPFCEALDVTLLTQPHAGPATARNTGTLAAKGKFLVFTDDDCVPSPDWLKTLAAQFALTPDCLIGGRTLNALPDNLYSTASQVLIDYLYSYYNANPKQARFFASNNFALPKESFEAIGGFDTSFPLAAGEDREFCDRWLQRGYLMIYLPESCVYHAHKLTLRKFWSQHFNYGRGAFRFHEICAQRHLEHPKREKLSFYLNLLGYPLSLATSHSVLLIGGLFFVSQVANAAGLAWEKFSRDVPQL
ncbi:MAG: glycosyltransferase [Kastovskya adunca ATA6-11-RM4]|jgi:GT2 family glycosyltransferase|nr:glycosyltransferase [Kastovskya adunca ATA6-11-RM4]